MDKADKTFLDEVEGFVDTLELTHQERCLLSIRVYLRSLTSLSLSAGLEMTESEGEKYIYLMGTGAFLFFKLLAPADFRYLDREYKVNFDDDHHTWALGHLKHLFANKRHERGSDSKFKSCILHSLVNYPLQGFDQFRNETRLIKGVDDKSFLTLPLWGTPNHELPTQPFEDLEFNSKLLRSQSKGLGDFNDWLSQRIEGLSVSQEDIWKWKFFFRSAFYHSSNIKFLGDFFSKIEVYSDLFSDFEGWVHWLGGVEKDLKYAVVSRLLTRVLLDDEKILKSYKIAPKLIISYLRILCLSMYYRKIPESPAIDIFYSAFQNLIESQSELEKIGSDFSNSFHDVMFFLSNSMHEPDLFWENYYDLYRILTPLGQADTAGSHLTWLNEDARFIELNENLEEFENSALWGNSGIKITWAVLERSLRNSANDWSVWADWLEERADGKPLVLNLEVGDYDEGKPGRVSFPGDDYLDPATINSKIRALFDLNSNLSVVEEGEVDRLLEQFPTTEEIVLSEDGKIDILAVPFEDRYSQNLIRIKKALTRCIARNALGEGSEQVDFIRTEILQNNKNPQKLYDECHFISSELKELIEKDVIPNQLSVKGLINAVNTASLDIEANVPEVRDVLIKRKNVSIEISDQTLNTKLDKLNANFENLRPILSDNVQFTFADDLLDLAGQKERANAAFRIFGRILKIHDFVVQSVGTSMVDDSLKLSLVYSQPYLEEMIMLLRAVIG